MSKNDRNEKKSPYPPPNMSVGYYDDPNYSTDAFFGYEHESGAEEECAAQKREDALDEPVESWGWINNVD